MILCLKWLVRSFKMTSILTSPTFYVIVLSKKCFKLIELGSGSSRDRGSVSSFGWKRGWSELVLSQLNLQRVEKIGVLGKKVKVGFLHHRPTGTSNCSINILRSNTHGERKVREVHKRLLRKSLRESIKVRIVILIQSPSFHP